ADSLTLGLQASSAGLAMESCWTADRSTGVISRKDTLTNTGTGPITVLRCLARMALPPARYEIYSQQSRWCNENQGAWQTLHAGEIVLRCVPGRTTQGGTPYACIRDTDTRRGLAFHIVPKGNWVIRFSAQPSMDCLPFIVVELGLSDENLRIPLLPGESFELPELLFQEIPEGEPHLAAPALHEYLLKEHFTGAKTETPVVYNTWFDQFERLDVARLRRQLEAARNANCEVFVVDAGWFGAGQGNWGQQVGDWREKIDAAFQCRMGEFADEVRAAGLGFGLWMEPERIGPEAPVRLEHPEWFVPCGDVARFDLSLPEAYAWLRDEMQRLIETYQLAWMKIDFNFDLDSDRAGLELSGYASLWYRMLDEVRAAFPHVFLEGCSSGAMRLDLDMLSHADGHFLSDNLEPVDMLRITQGAFLRLPPGPIMRWAGLRSPGKLIPRYGLCAADSPDTVLVPGGGLWEPAECVDLDFALLAAMPGVLGLTGDLASLPPAVAERVREHVTFFKEWRRFISGTVAHLLTPPEPVARRSGWVAFQLQNPADSASLLFVYRLGVSPRPLRWRLRGLKPDVHYTAQRMLIAGACPTVFTGEELMASGLDTEIPAGGSSRSFAAALYAVRPE
ncbi:alpha-galactosidase, partial [bacterium]|nr:alpha-galactosidase [bacterium]